MKFWHINWQIKLALTETHDFYILANDIRIQYITKPNLENLNHK